MRLHVVLRLGRWAASAACVPAAARAQTPVSREEVSALPPSTLWPGPRMRKVLPAHAKQSAKRNGTHVCGVDVFIRAITLHSGVLRRCALACCAENTWRTRRC